MTDQPEGRALVDVSAELLQQGFELPPGVRIRGSVFSQHPRSVRLILAGPGLPVPGYRGMALARGFARRDLTLPEWSWGLLQALRVRIARQHLTWEFEVTDG